MSVPDAEGGRARRAGPERGGGGEGERPAAGPGSAKPQEPNGGASPLGEQGIVCL